MRPHGNRKLIEMGVQPKNKPDWFYRLSPEEQRKQIRRWRYHRSYQRKRLGDRWELVWCLTFR